MRHLPAVKKTRFLASFILATTTISSLMASTATPATGQAQDTEKKPLTGGISNATLRAHAGLKEVDASVKMLQRSAMDMIGEVERTDWVVAAEPEAIGPIIVPAISYSTQGLGDLDPPRKKWIDFLMNQTAQLIDMTNADINATRLTDNAPPEATSAWSDIKSLMLDVVAHYQNLKGITQGPKYDNLKIGKQALGIYDDMTRVEGLIKKITCLIRG